MADQWVSLQGILALLQIAPHEEFLEGELPKPHLIFDFPALSIDDEVAKHPEDSIDIHAALIRGSYIRDFKGNTEVTPQFLQQRRINSAVFVSGRHFDAGETRSDTGPLKGYWDQQDGGAIDGF